MSGPDLADVLVARAADRIALAAMRGDAAAALEFVRDLHEHRADVCVVLRTEARGGAPVRGDQPAKPMPAKFAGRCVSCNGPINVGTPIFYDSATRRATHVRCA